MPLLWFRCSSRPTTPSRRFVRGLCEFVCGLCEYMFAVSWLCAVCAAVCWLTEQDGLLGKYLSLGENYPSHQYGAATKVFLLLNVAYWVHLLVVIPLLKVSWVQGMGRGWLCVVGYVVDMWSRCNVFGVMDVGGSAILLSPYYSYDDSGFCCFSPDGRFRSTRPGPGSSLLRATRPPWWWLI